MKKERALTLALALVCLFAVGSAFGSLESAVDSSPSEAIDLDYSSLPIDKGQASDIKREYQSLTDDSQAKPEETSKANSGGSASESKSSGGEKQRSASSASEQTEQKSGMGTGETVSIVDKLLAALLALLSSVIKFLVAVIVLVAAAVAVRYREQIAARLGQYFDRTDQTSAETHGVSESLPPANPQNEVTEAWYEMVRRLKLDDEEPLTPRERAAIARRKGADANTIWSLTELFEEVEYGGAPVTEDRRRRARQYLDRFRRYDGGEER